MSIECGLFYRVSNAVLFTQIEAKEYDLHIEKNHLSIKNLIF